ncbi:unnamed protein product, partial [Mesorhabditis spiculigera]
MRPPGPLRHAWLFVLMMRKSWITYYDDSQMTRGEVDVLVDVVNPIFPASQGDRLYGYWVADIVDKAALTALIGQFCGPAPCALTAFTEYQQIVDKLRTDPNGTLYRGLVFNEVDLKKPHLSYDFLLPDDNFNASIGKTWNNGDEPFAMMGQWQQSWGANTDGTDAKFMHSLNAAFLKLVKGAELPAVTMVPMVNPDVAYEFWMDANSFLPIIIAIVVLPTMIYTAREIAAEKESGMKDFLSVMGMSRGVFLSSHIFIGWLKAFIIAGACLANPAVGFVHHPWYIQPAFIFVPLVFYTLACMICAAAIAFVVIVHSGLIALFIIPPLQPSVYSPWMACLASLNYNSAYGYSLLSARSYLLRNRGLTGSTFFEDTDNIFNVGPATLMTIFDCLWMILVIIAAELYHKYTDFSMAIAIKRWLSKGKVGSSSEIDEIQPIPDGHEKRSENGHADIVVEHLQKVWGSTGEMAVKDMNLKAYRGEVTVLLGHNGAGKSTTFSVISGLTPPSSGRVEVTTNNVGLCPQGNALFDRLTVMEHLWFFHQIKGATNDWRKEGKAILASLGLSEKKNTYSMALSGGMKRKLCLAMSLIGDSKVVLLDEPTAGMDIGARNDVQKMLDVEKRERTILLTTHYMDEAEALGDRIVIMVKGKDVASGSTHFLERRFGTGYTLIVVFDEGKAGDKMGQHLLQEVQSLIPSATLCRFHGKQVEISLPNHENLQFPRLFAYLEAHQVQLGVSSFGLSASNLEQVFLTVGELCEHAEDGSAARKDMFDKDLDERINLVASLPFQFLFLLWKRILYSIRNWSQWLYQIVLPMLIIFLMAKFVDFNGLGETDGGVTKDGHLLALNSMGKMAIGLDGAANVKLYDAIRRAGNLKVYEDPIPADSRFRLPPFGAHVFQANNSLTFAVNPNSLWAHMTLFTALANSYLDDGGIDVNVRVVKRLHHLDDEDKDSMEIVEDYYVSAIVVLVFSMLTSPFAIYIVLERVSRFAHQQFLTKMPTLMLYTTSVLYEAIIYFFVAGLMLIAFRIGDWDKGENLRVFWCMALYFVAIHPATYLLCAMFDSPSKANTMILIIQSFGAFICIITVMTVQLSSDWEPIILQDVFQALCPTYGLSRGVVMARMLGRGKGDDVDQDNNINLIRYHRVLWIFACNAAGYLLLYILIRFPPLQMFCARCCKKPTPPITNEDDLVYRERELVEGATDKYSLKTRKLTKNYGKFTAVNRLSFGVKSGECFGLLGVNGAGKTTTFGILTGSLYPTEGSAYIGGSRVLGIKSMGYCPQFDAYLLELTGREVLALLATLLGYYHPFRKADSLLRAVLMERHGDKLLKHCSGGQKRKISVGISLLAQKHVILLDEPTAGIDPRARREIWSLVGAVRETEGRAVLLSSHSMDECEALCTRVGIMAHGVLRTVGTTQQIKSRYGNTYQLVLMFPHDQPRDCSFDGRVQDAVSSAFPGSTQHRDVVQSNIFKFTLPRRPEDLWSEMWLKCAKMGQSLGAEDFSLAQASLIETFLNVTGEKAEAEPVAGTIFTAEAVENMAEATPVVVEESWT